MKRLSALLATVVLALCFGASQAVAAEGDQGAGQAAGQSAGSGQSASGYGGAYQAGPTNSAGSIRVLSPGDNGSVTQSNDTTAAAIAANGNKTTQGVDQSQAGGYGSDQTQIAGQEAKNAQYADANAKAKQIDPKNESLSIRVLSPGDGGNVTQSNSAGAGSDLSRAARERPSGDRPPAANRSSCHSGIDRSRTGAPEGSEQRAAGSPSAADTPLVTD